MALATSSRAPAYRDSGAAASAIICAAETAFVIGSTGTLYLGPGGYAIRPASDTRAGVWQALKAKLGR